MKNNGYLECFREILAPNPVYIGSFSKAHETRAGIKYIIFIDGYKTGDPGREEFEVVTQLRLRGGWLTLNIMNIEHSVKKNWFEAVVEKIWKSLDCGLFYEDTFTGKNSRPRVPGRYLRTEDAKK